MTTTIKLPVEIENLIDSICYSGAFSTYSWYDTFRETDEGRYYLGIRRPGDDNETVYTLLDADVLAKTIEDIVGNEKPGWESVLHGALYDDFDANSADTVLQYAVFGSLEW